MCFLELLTGGLVCKGWVSNGKTGNRQNHPELHQLWIINHQLLIIGPAIVTLLKFWSYTFNSYCLLPLNVDNPMSLWNFKLVNGLKMKYHY